MGYKDVMVVIIVNTVFTVIAFNNVITAIASVLLCRLVCYTNRVKIWLALQGEIFKENLSVALLSWSSFLTNCCINFCFFCKTNFATKSCQEQSEEETVTWHHCYQSTFCFPPLIAAHRCAGNTHHTLLLHYFSGLVGGIYLHLSVGMKIKT